MLKRMQTFMLYSDCNKGFRFLDDIKKSIDIWFMTFDLWFSV